MDYLARRRCRTLFSTHYHSLVHDLSGHPQVRLGTVNASTPLTNDTDY